LQVALKHQDKYYAVLNTNTKQCNMVLPISRPRTGNLIAVPAVIIAENNTGAGKPFNGSNVLYRCLAPRKVGASRLLMASALLRWFSW
jgi:hypothetical protein